jgi:beta-galactosidase
MAGIHRSVELIRRPRLADILDYQVQADASGHISCHVEYRRRRSTDSKIVVRLYDDEQITPDGDQWKPGKCVWTMASDDLSGDSGTCCLSDDIVVTDLRLWTAETPNLYTLTISLETKSNESGTAGKVLQAESCRVGFRTVEIHDGAVHVNGRRIMVCGMNRHEHDPDHGKVVSLERMKQDICLLKYVCACSCFFVWLLRIKTTSCFFPFSCL